MSQIFVIVGFFILIFMGRPIIFKQQRPGFNSKLFTIFKFRTMNNSSYENTGGYNLDGVLGFLIGQDYIEKPKFDYDDRWFPSPDDDIVNEHVRERLSEIDI